jgi:conjugal transfer mating pair stabilization protein TraN
VKVGQAQKILAILQAVIQLWVTVFLLYWSVARPLPAYADRFSDVARQGQNMGRGLVPNPSILGSQDANGNINLNWKGQTSTFDPGALFPDKENTSDPHAAEAFGNDAQLMNRAHAATQTMGNSNSFTGKAYQTITGSINRARVDMSNDPLWQQTDAAIERSLSGVDTNCEIITTSETITSQTHVPDLETCERVYYPGGDCNCRHDYTVEFAGQYTVGAWGQSSNSITLSVNVQTGSVSCSGCQGGSGVENWSPPPANACGASGEGVMRIAASTFSPYAGASLSQAPTCANGMVAVFTVQNTGHHPEQLHAGTLAVNMYHIVDHGWTCDPGCEVLLTNVHGDSIIRPESYSCTLGPCEGATMIAGAWVDQGMLYSTNPFASVGISNLAHKVTIALQDFNQGVLNCWTDPQGVVHCPENPGNLHDTCEALENNPNCSFVRQECIEGAQDPESGICYAWTVVYDCGTEVGIDEVTTTMGYQCDGIIRCFGEECIDGQFDLNNNGFAKTAAMMQVVDYAASDMDCTGGDCVIWTGENIQCKKALGGYVNCCEKPENVSIGDYMTMLGNARTLAAANWDLTSVIPGPLGTNPLSGAWSQIENCTADITNVLSDTFTSAWDSLVGNPGIIEQAAGAPATGGAVGSAGLTQMLMNGANGFLRSISTDLASAIFTTNAMGEVVFTAAAQMVVSMVNFVMWVYAIYQILDLLVHIIWACEQEEFELGAKRQLKVCHYVGSYCASDIVGICIEKKETYCCYNSPLARIMQEQIRIQGVDGGWGSGKHPNCGGLTPAQLAGVNWDAVDLSEWLALLAIGGQYPTQRDVSIDGLTGSGSQFNFSNTSSPRPDAASRTQGRIEQSGVDLEQSRIQGGLNLWGQGGQQ